MNVSADLLFALAQACGAPGDYRADGVVRHATERLKGEKEYWVEVFEQNAWLFHSCHPEVEGAILVKGNIQRSKPEVRVRVVEILRRVHL